MPALSPSMESGTVVEWKKKVGDLVKENEVFCTIQTDKAVVDYTNTFEPGYLAKIFVQNGGVAPVAKTIAVMVDDAADLGKADEYKPEGEESAEAESVAASSAPAAAPAAAASAPAAASPATGGTTSEPPEDVDVQAVFMPALSPSMESGTVVEWKKKVGDLVKENEVFCTIQTDKAVVDYTNTFEPGYLAKIFCQNGESGEVAKTIALMVPDPSDIAKVASYVPADAVGGGAAAEASAAAPAPTPAAAPTPTAVGGKVKRYGNSLEEAVAASGPSVVRIAAGLDDAVLETIVPTGKDGRFRKEDFKGQPGFNYDDANVTVKQHRDSPSAAKASATGSGASPAATGLEAATSAGSQAGDIYNVVITAGPVKKSLDDSPVLRKLIATMPIPKPKKAKKAAA